MPKKLIDPRSSITEETSRRIANALEYIAISDAKDIDITDYQQIANIVKAGRAKDFFEIGDQIPCTFTIDENRIFDFPWNIVDFGPCEDPDGVIHENAMWLESKFTSISLQYAGYESLYVPDKEMPAGTYNFKIGDDYSSVVHPGDSFQFTTTKPIPLGGQIALGSTSYDRIIFNADILTQWRIRTYSDRYQREPLEIITITEGDDGTNIGTLYRDNDRGPFGMNTFNIYNDPKINWSRSVVRQWLNSDRPAGEWWRSSDNFQRLPLKADSIPGFISYMPSDFAKIVKPVKIFTAYDLWQKIEATNDKFFIASLEQEYVAHFAEGEGQAFEYWKQRLDNAQPFGGGYAYAGRRRALMTNHASAKSYWLRSFALGNSSTCVSVSGYVSNATASGTSVTIAPCCVIY